MSERLPVRLWRALSAAWRNEPTKRRAYLAAAPHRLLNDWSGTSQSANKSTRYQAKSLRHRARELGENSPIIARFAGLMRDNVIGSDGVTLQAVVPSTRGENKAESEKLEKSFYRWARKVTPDGRSLVDVCKTLVESRGIEGEALLELIPSSASPFGCYVLPLDVDLLDERLNVERTPSGGSIVQGVEFDALGRVAAFHILTSHPSDGQQARHRILPADRLLRWAHCPRPGQVRGVTPLAPVMLLVHHLERLQEAVVTLNRVTAAKMGALIPGELAEPLEDDDGNPPQIEQAPAEWWTLPRGWDVKMLDPGQPTQEYDPLTRNLLREIASGLNVAYASLTGDLSDVNYSSMRAGLLVERDVWAGLQAEFIETILDPLFRFWLRCANLSTAIAIPVGQTVADIADASTWHPRRWPWVDPLKDAQGIELLLSLGLTTLTREANKQGLSFDDIVEERAKELDAMKKAGVEPHSMNKPTTSPTGDTTQTDSSAPARSLRAIS